MGCQLPDRGFLGEKRKYRLPEWVPQNLQFDPLLRPLNMLFRSRNCKLNLRLQRIPIPQMLSLRIITDNVVLIRRVEIVGKCSKSSSSEALPAFWVQAASA